MKAELEFICIDGNLAKRNVVAYCAFKKGHLTKAIAKTHRCVERKCKCYIPIVSFLQKSANKLGTGVYVVEIKNS